MTDEQIDALVPLPPYLYGRETVANERVFTEAAVHEHTRAAVRAALASRQAKTNYERDMEDTLFQIAKAAGFAVSKDQGLDPDVLIAKVKSMAIQWRPIETAPKDMRAHLFLCSGVAVQGFRGADDAMYVSRESGVGPHPPWRLMRRKPTAWMPLPYTPGEQQ